MNTEKQIKDWDAKIEDMGPLKDDYQRVELFGVMALTQAAKKKGGIGWLKREITNTKNKQNEKLVKFIVQMVAKHEAHMRLILPDRDQSIVTAEALYYINQLKSLLK